jgi:hypothetical protein
MIKSRRMRWVGDLNVRDHSEDIGVDGKVNNL